MSTVVAGRLGNVALPVPLGSAGEPFPAPHLDAILGYLAAYLRAYVGERWKRIAPNEPIVRRAYTHDPQEYDFSSGDLPALYIWPSGSAADVQQETDDWQVQRETLHIAWVLPNAEQTVQAKRSRAREFVADTIFYALRIGRDPSWVAEDDPDPTAAERGSVLLRHAGLETITPKQWQPTRIAIKPWKPGLDRVESDLYDAIICKVEIRKTSERLYGVDNDHPERGRFGGGGNAYPAALEFTVSVDGQPMADARFPVGYAMLYVQDGATAQTIGTTPTKLTGFTAAGLASGLEPDASNDRIVVADAGVYEVSAAFSVLGTAGRVAQLRLRKNDVEEPGLGGRAVLAATVGPLAFAPGLVACEAGDVLTIYAEADVASTSFTPVDGSFVVTRRQ